MIRVLLVDDQKTVIETLKVILEPEPDIEIVGTADNGITAIEQVKILRPDVAIVNLKMPDLDGASATQQITSNSPTKVLIHTCCDDEEHITKSLAMGAKGYLLKSFDTKDLAIAIRNIYKGYTQISPGLLDKLLVYTDSGVVLSKLQGSSQLKSAAVTLPSQSPKTISHLELAYRQQQKEIIKIRQSWDSDRQELPKLRQTLDNHSKQIWLILLSSIAFLSLLGLSLLRLYNQTNNLQLRAIPTERIGLYGEFSLNGIAQRVSKVFEQDSVLKNIATVYVAQEDDAIVLTGSVTDAAVLKRMENIAMQVTGVKKVYTSQVIVRPKLTENIVGSP